MSRSVRLPAERFYWAVLPVPGVGRTLAATPAVLTQMLEPEVPLPPSELHAAFLRLDDNRVLACAMAKAELAGADAISIKPAAAPDFVGRPHDLDSLELLTGEFLPRPIRRERSRRWAAVLASLLIVATLVCIGFARRAANWRGVEAAADAAARSLLAEAIGTPTAAREGVALLAEQLGRERSLQRAAPDTPDAAHTLSTFLSEFPRGTELRTELVSITPTTVSVNLTFPDDPRPFLRSLRPLQGWSLDEPRLSKDGTSTRVSIQYRRKEAAK